MLAAFLQFLLNLLLIGSMLAFVACSVYLSITADNIQERYIRLGVLFSGGLVVLGAQAGGLDFPEFIAKALSDTGATATGASVVVSGAAGAGTGLFLIKWAHNGGVFAIRIMIFVGTLAATQFAEIYVSALHSHGFGLGPAVVPNIAFVVGILLCIALTYDPKNPRRSRRLIGQLQGARARVPRRPLEEEEPPLGASPTRAEPRQ
jgi:hypothetical protein